MDVIASLDPSNARWSDGSVEDIAVTVRLIDDEAGLYPGSDTIPGAGLFPDGVLSPSDVTGVGFSSYYDDPAVWYPPDTAETVTTGTVEVRLLLGDVVQPAQIICWVWVQVRQGDETATRVCRNVRLDLTRADWTVYVPPVLLLTSTSLLTSPTLVTTGS